MPIPQMPMLACAVPSLTCSASVPQRALEVVQCQCVNALIVNACMHACVHTCLSPVRHVCRKECHEVVHLVVPAALLPVLAVLVLLPLAALVAVPLDGRAGAGCAAVRAGAAAARGALVLVVVVIVRDGVGKVLVGNLATF